MWYNIAHMDVIMFVTRYTLYFTIFAVMGYFVELLNTLPRKKKISNRGFLFGPYLPIYGFGAIIMIMLSKDIPKDNLFIVFLVAMAIGVILEYSTSYILEKIFHLRWWDYSKTHKFNINGRICLRNSLLFGLGGCIFISFLVPLADKCIDFLPQWLQITLAGVMLVIYTIDVVASSYANMKVKNMEEFSKAIGYQTAEIKKNAKKVIKELFATPEKIAKKIEKARRKAERKAKRRAKRAERKKR